MKISKLQKFDGSKIDGENLGHTENEWGRPIKSAKNKIEDGLL